MKLFSILFSSALLISTLSACQNNLPMMPTSAIMQRQSARVVVRVVPDSAAGVWHVKVQGNAQPASSHRTKEQAIVAGRTLAKQAPLGQLVIYKANGQIETEYTYGNDPANSHG